MFDKPARFFGRSLASSYHRCGIFVNAGSGGSLAREQAALLRYGKHCAEPGRKLRNKTRSEYNTAMEYRNGINRAAGKENWAGRQEKKWQERNRRMRRSRKKTGWSGSWISGLRIFTGTRAAYRAVKPAEKLTGKRENKALKVHSLLKIEARRSQPQRRNQSQRRSQPQQRKQSKQGNQLRREKQLRRENHWTDQKRPLGRL